MNKGAKLISEAILGYNIKVVVVNNKRYTIKPPTIRVLAGAGYELCDFSVPDRDATYGDILKTLGNARKLAAGLSWFVNGDGSLTDELSAGTLNELAKALEAAYNMVDVRDFTKAVGIAKFVAELTAKQL